METEQVIRDFIVDNFLFGVREKLPGDDESFLQRGLIDSTGILEIVNFVEVRFGVRVEDEELLPDNLDSIRRLAEFVRRKQA